MLLIGVLTSCQSPNLNRQESSYNSELTSSNNFSNGNKKFGPSWQELYFPEILERIQLSSISALELENLPSEVSEIRVWGLFDFAPPRCLIMRKADSNFSFMLLPPLATSEKRKLVKNQRKTVQLSAPKSGSEFLWNYLLVEDIFNIPDAEEVDAHNPYPDAPVVVIETKTNNIYRAVLYNGLDTAEKAEAKKVLKICRTLEKEFGIELCKM